MTDAEKLAERYLALWTQYLTALLADPRAMDTLKRWMAFTGQFAYPASGTAPPGAPPFSAWPPFFGPFAPPPPSTADGDGIAALTRRVDELERRLAEVERAGKPVTRRSRRRTRGGGSIDRR
ncbi:MAG: hypothetical protein WB697_10410 [Stellaceae bacterium]